MQWEKINCVVFDFAGTLCSNNYFKNGPPNFPNWYELFQENIFVSNNHLFQKWMAGKVNSSEVSQFMEPHLGLGKDEIQYWMREGCKNLILNQSVLDLVKRSKLDKKKTALVTGNIDLFTTVVAPNLTLENLFDVTINSYDYREIDKTILWSLAFEKLGIDSNYKHSLLIEDSKSNVDEFKNRGGAAFHYQGEAGMKLWTSENIRE